MKDFKGKVPPVEVLVSHMHLGKRSFQRKLNAEGSGYRQLYAHLKKELAVNLLKHSGAKVDTISEILGYTESSAFRKAFRSWTNTTPVQLKKTRLVD